MAMTLEEVMIKLKLDSSTVVTDLNKFKSSIGDATTHAHKSFIHAGSAARGFHKLLEEISAQSPIMGTALKVAMDPIVGTLTAATLAFGFFNEKLKEWNKLMDERATKNAQAVTNNTAIQQAISSERERNAESFKQARAVPEGPVDEWVTEARKRIDAMPPSPMKAMALRNLYAMAQRNMGLRTKSAGSEITERGKVGETLKGRIEKAKQEEKHFADLVAEEDAKAKSPKNIEAQIHTPWYLTPFWKREFWTGQNPDREEAELNEHNLEIHRRQLERATRSREQLERDYKDNQEARTQRLKDYTNTAKAQRMASGIVSGFISEDIHSLQVQKGTRIIVTPTGGAMQVPVFGPLVPGLQLPTGQGQSPMVAGAELVALLLSYLKNEGIPITPAGKD